MTEDHNERDPLEELAAEFTERCRTGAQPSVEEYAARHPQMANDIRELFSMIRDVEQAKQVSGSSPVILSSDETPSPTRLGDFRIIRELGRGGMGIVYEAEQESLGRRVAIKVLSGHHLWHELRRERFAREARIAGKLHHTNIVPIFGVGEENNHHYIVMQYIRGVGLDAVFSSLSSCRPAAADSGGSSCILRESDFDFASVARDLLDRRGSVDRSNVTTVLGRTPHGRVRSDDLEPSDERPHHPPARDTASNGASASLLSDRRYYRNLAHLMAQAADALAYAHDQGVLHRDIKPANLLLDADGSLWIADFGLAKAVEHQEITQAGDVLGTLRYMSPEQYQGRGEARSDIYSLGVTLYELATLHTAFATERERGTVIEAVLDKRLVPPRQHCPAIPRDLETIILKATALEPGHRYGSAADLRDDLRRFVEDRPILARRASAAERLWRWSRRNPALAATSGLAMALVVSIAIISSAAYFNVRQAKLQAQRALEGEMTQRERAEATAGLAVEAIDTIFDEFAPENPLVSRELSLDEADQADPANADDETTVTLSVPPVLSQETANLLSHMLGFYRRLAQQEGGSRDLQLKIAGAQRRVGEIQAMLGRYPEAKAAYADSIQQYEQLAAASPEDQALPVAIARIHNHLGHLLLDEDDVREAYEHLGAARHLLEKLTSAENARADARFELARSSYLMGRPGAGGWLMGGQMRPPPDEDRGRFGPGPPDTERFVPSPPDGPGADFPPEPPPWALRNREGERGGPRPDRRERSKLLEEAITILDQLTAESPEVPEYRHLLAQCLREQRPGPPFAGEPDETNTLDRAVEILRGLVAEFPHVPQYRLDLAETYALQDRRPDGRERLEDAIRIMKEVVRENPDIPSYQLALADKYVRLSRLDRAGQDMGAAIGHLREAVARGRQVAERFPDIEPCGLIVASHESALAHLLEDRREYDEARLLLESSVRRVQPLVDAATIRPQVRHVAFRGYVQLASVYRQQGEIELAEQARRTADALMPVPPVGRSQTSPARTR